MPGKSKADSARNWSWAKALVGPMTSALPWRMRSPTASAMGSW
jgi:hypothetical protein